MNTTPHSLIPARWFLLLPIALGIGLLAGCSDKQDTPPPAPAANAGKVIIKGSNTIGEELGPRLVAEYKKDHPNATIEIESKATGYGFAALLANQCNVAAASRPPIKEEMELAQTRGVELNDHVIGSYSVAVILNAANPVSDLSKDQVRDIFTGKIQNWKDAGGTDAPIHLLVRDPISGTYLGFRELAMDNKAYGSGLKTCTNYAAIAAAVAENPGAIGYCSFDLESKPGIKAVNIQGVAPSADAVKEGKYPYARLLHLYTSKGQEDAPAREFIEFAQSAKGQEIIKQSGNVPK
jgi:phosphate transport system substrate-binding protein